MVVGHDSGRGEDDADGGDEVVAKKVESEGEGTIAEKDEIQHITYILSLIFLLMNMA